MKKGFALAVHGGCGNVVQGRFSAREEKAYLQTLEQSLRAGTHCLEEQGSSLEAVEAAVKVLEDSPLFNAGRGSVFTHEGSHEMDAAIMDGRTEKAGAVAGVRRIRNPVLAARNVLEHSSHVMLSGQGAEAFAKEHGLEFASEEWFHDEKRWEQYQEALREDTQFMDHSSDKDKHGTVGAVARDLHGDLAAATSTGGITNKKHGRIGDSPIIGAGTYAANDCCAVSCTGEGEYFLRGVTAHQVASLIRYGHRSLDEASEEALNAIKALGGEGGLIAIDQEGRIAMPFNSGGMFRGCTSEEGELSVEMYKG